MVKRRGRLVVIVTGANGGIGFEICHRLLVQLSRREPSDALPQPNLTKLLKIEDLVQEDERFPEYDGLTLILACRSAKKAAAARTDLLRLLDDDISKQRREVTYDGYADEFKQKLEVVYHHVDLGDVKSVFKFSREITENFPYVSALVCNAGLASIRTYDWLLATKDILIKPIEAVTYPEFKLQNKGVTSADGLGWVWQCNVFGHYVMYRCLQEHLARYHAITQSPARVVWESSIEARPQFYDAKDWQLVETWRSYEASKYQIDLLAGCLESQQKKDIDSTHANSESNQPPIRHILVHPGIVVSGIASGSLHDNIVLIWLLQLIFYYARLLGSTNHVITCYNAAISAVHVVLVSLSSIPTAAVDRFASSDSPPTPLKFASQTTRLGKDYVDAQPVLDWETRWKDGVDLIEKCENLYQKYLSEIQGTG